jgi:hypothetical protein
MLPRWGQDIRKKAQGPNSFDLFVESVEAIGVNF